MSSFAQGLQSGLAAVQKYTDIAKQAEERKKKKARDAEFKKITEAEQKSGLDTVVDNLTSATDDQGRQLIRTTGVNDQGLTTFEQLNPETGEYFSDADNVLQTQAFGDKTMYLGQTYDKPLTAAQQTAARNKAYVDVLMSQGDFEGATEFARGLADIESVRAGTEQTRASTGLTQAQAQAQETKNRFLPQEIQSKLNLTDAQVENVNARTQNIFDQLDLDKLKVANQVDQFGKRLELDQTKVDNQVAQFQQTFKQGVAEFAAKNDQFFARLGLDQANTDSLIATRAQQMVNEGLRIDETKSQNQVRNEFNQIKFEHDVKQDAVNNALNQARVDLDAGRLALQEANSEADRARIAQGIKESEFKLQNLQRTRNGVELSYLGNSLAKGDDAMANQLIDENLDLIKGSLRPPEGTGMYDDIDVLDKDDFAMTVGYKDAEGNVIGTRVIPFDYLESQSNMLQGNPRTPDTSSLIRLRTSMSRDLGNLMEGDAGYDELRNKITNIDSRLATQLEVDEGDVQNAIKNRELRLTYRPLDTQYKAVVDRRTGKVDATGLDGRRYVFDSIAQYNDAKTKGTLDGPAADVPVDVGLEN
jgi:hypothetical protein